MWSSFLRLGSTNGPISISLQYRRCARSSVSSFRANTSSVQSNFRERHRCRAPCTMAEMGLGCAVTNGHADNMSGTSPVPQIADNFAAMPGSAALGPKAVVLLGGVESTRPWISDAIASVRYITFLTQAGDVHSSTSCQRGVPKNSKNWPTTTGQGALRTWSPPMTAEPSVEESHDHTPHRAWCRAWRRRRGVERHVRKYPNRTKDLRAGARGLAWRLVLAAHHRFAATTGPYGVHADPDWAWRTLTSDEPGHQSRYPHHRCGQCLQMGGPQRHRSGRAFLRRLGDIRRRRAGAAARQVDCLSRCLHAGGRRHTLYRQRPRGQPQGYPGRLREGRGLASGAARGDAQREREGPLLGRFQDDAATARSLAPANPAHRCARPGGEEDLHPGSIISESDFR